MSAENGRYQFFAAAVPSPANPKTTIMQIQWIRSLDKDIWYSFPDYMMSTYSHPKLVELSSMKSTMKALKSQGQSRNVNVGLLKDVYSLYVDADDNFVFGDHMLAET